MPCNLKGRKRGMRACFTPSSVYLPRIEKSIEGHLDTTPCDPRPWPLLNRPSMHGEATTSPSPRATGPLIGGLVATRNERDCIGRISDAVPSHPRGARGRVFRAPRVTRKRASGSSRSATRARPLMLPECHPCEQMASEQWVCTPLACENATSCPGTWPRSSWPGARS